MNFDRLFVRFNLFKIGYWRWLWLAIAIVIFPLPVRANCVDNIASVELVEPAIKRHWQQLKQQTQFPWGQINPYHQINRDRIDLNANFDKLTGTQKRQVLALLKLEYNNNWFELLTPVEQTAALKHPGMGAMSPVSVYASDGRAVSLPYDGCTRMTLLTERDRFSWYSQQLERDGNSTQTRSMLRNVGTPPWRIVKFPISTRSELTVRQQFWQSVGFSHINAGWWIAWVPERGYFEINVPINYSSKVLQKFWRFAPRQYRYLVMANDGTPLKYR